MPKSSSKSLSIHRRGGSRQISSTNKNTFVYVLYQLASDPNVKEIHWSDNGTTFTVYKEPFTNNVLNQYFETEKYTSFTRQHYIYNFTKLTDGRKDKSLKGVARYQHKYFQRDRPELLGLIKRIQTSKKASETHGQETKTERIRLSTLGKEDAIIKAEPMSVVTAADTPMPASDAALFTVVPKIEAAPSQYFTSVDVTSARSTAHPQTYPASENIRLSPLRERLCGALQTLNDECGNMSHEDLDFAISMLYGLVKQMEDTRDTHPMVASKLSIASPNGHSFNVGNEPPMNINRPMEGLRVQDMCMPFTPGVPPVSAGIVMGTGATTEPSTPGGTVALPVSSAFMSNQTVLTRQISAFPLPTIAENTGVSEVTVQPGFSSPTNQSAMYALDGTDMYTTAPPSAPIFGSSPPMGLSSDGSPNTSTTAEPVPLMTAPVAGSFPLLYPPPAGGQQPLNISALDMLNTMPFASVSSVLPSVTSGANACFMQSNADSGSAHMNLCVPRSASTISHARVASSPANIFYGNMQAPF